MGMKGFSKKVVFTVLTVSFLAAATTIVTAREFPPPSALGIDTEPWFQLTNFGALLWVSFLILFLSAFWKFANNDPADTYAAACSELQHSPDNLYSFSMAASLYDTSAAVDGLGPLSTPELRLIESTTENETGSQQNLLRLEGTEPVTDIIAHNQEIPRLDQEVADDAVDNYVHSEHNIVMNETSTEVEDQNCSQRGGQKTITGTTKKSFCGIILSNLQQQFGKKMEDAAKCLGVSRSTFKRCCRANGIAKWSRNLKVQPHAATTSNSMLGLATTSSAVPPHAAATSNSIIGLATMSSAVQPQSDNTMSVKVSYKGINVRFPFAFSSGKNALEAEVGTRFGLQMGSFSISYEDEDKDWIIITCDTDLHHGMHICKTKGLTQMKMKVEPLRQSS